MSKARFSLKIAACALLCGVGLAAQAAPVQAWRQSGYDAAQTRYNPNESQLNSNTVARLRPVWSAETAFYRTAPIAEADGVVYQCGSNLTAHDPTTGVVLWSVPGCGTAPALVGNLVLGSAVSGHSMVEVGAYNKNKAGAKVWRQTFAGEHISAPTVANGVVYVSVSYGFQNIAPPSVYALDAKTGVVLWQGQAPADKTVFYDNGVSVADGVVYLSDHDWVPKPKGRGRITAFDAITGTQLWSVIRSTLYVPVAVADGLVYFGEESGRATALDAKTGAEVWSLPKKASGWLFLSPAVAGGTVLFPAPGGVAAFEGKTGKPLREFRISAARLSSDIVVANNVVYLTLDSFGPGAIHTLFALDFFSLMPVYTSRPLGGSDSMAYSLQVVDGKLYASDTNGSLRAYGLPPQP